MLLIVIGLTGGIASGKSTVSSLLKDKGAVIIDADEIAKNIMMPGTCAWKRVVEYFGVDVLKSDKSIDRKKLADIVFSNKEKLKALNSFTHPEILKEIKSNLKHHKNAGAKIVVIDAALLIETGLNNLVDEVWVIALDEKTQLERLMSRERNLTREQASNRIKSQMPLKQKLKYADRIIDNNGSLEEMKIQLNKIWREITQL